MMKYKKATLFVLLLLIIVLAVSWQNIYKSWYLKAVYPRKYVDLVDKYAAESNIDKNLVYAVIKNESNFKPNAESNVGAIGLMQIQPDTFNWAQSKTEENETFSDDDLYKPEVNIKYGTIILASLLSEFKDNGTAIAAYHAGRSNVNKWLADKTKSKDGKTLDYIPFVDTRNYVAKVIETKKVYDNIYD
jgi:soluble lytic murein transglycosylase